MEGGPDDNKGVMSRQPGGSGPERSTTPSEGRLRYAALDEGLTFFNEDGSRHVFASKAEEQAAFEAAAHHMTSGQQTEGAPEVDLVMLQHDGQTPDLGVASRSSDRIAEAAQPAISENAPITAAPEPAPPAFATHEGEAGPMSAEHLARMREHPDFSAPIDPNEPVDFNEALRDIAAGRPIGSGGRAPENAPGATSALDPAKFTQATVGAGDWTGRDPESTYTHPDAPGKVFSADEYRTAVREAAHAPATEPVLDTSAEAVEFSEMMRRLEDDLRANYDGIPDTIYGAKTRFDGYRERFESEMEQARANGEEIKPNASSSFKRALEAMRARFAREELGSRATQVARAPEGEAPSQGSRLSDVVPTPDWGAAPKLLKGAREFRQREIQADKELERSFLIVVNRLDPRQGAEIYHRLLEAEHGGANLEGSDLAFLAYARAEFSNRLKIGETLQDKITASDLQIAKRRNEALRNEVDLDSDEVALGYMKQQAMVLAMKMSDVEAREIMQAYQILDRDRSTSRYKIWEHSTQSLLKRAGVGWEEYKDVFKLEDKEARIATRHELEKRIAEGRSAIRNVLSWANPLFGRSRFSQADRMVQKAMSLEKALSKPGTEVHRVDEQLGVITNFMQLSLTHDPEARRAFQQSAMRNEDLVAAETRPLTYGEMRTERKRVLDQRTLSPQSIKTAFEQEMNTKAEKIGDRPYANWTVDEKKARFDRWAPATGSPLDALRTSEMQKVERRGFFSSILSWLFSSLFDKHKQQVSFA